MKPSFTSQEKEFTIEFGKLLIRHQHEVTEAQTAGGEIDRRAKKFARYLRAARSHASLTPPELAEKANVPEPMIYALERGMISSKRMQVAHLQRLSTALGEELEMFGLILDRDLSMPPVLVKKQIKRVNFISNFIAFLLLGLILMVLFVLSPSNYTENDPYLAIQQETSVGGGTNSVQNTIRTQSIGIDIAVPQYVDTVIKNKNLTMYANSVLNDPMPTASIPPKISIDESKVELKNEVTDKPSRVTARLVLYVTMILALLSLLVWLFIKNGEFPSFPSGVKQYQMLNLPVPLLVTACLLFAVFGSSSLSGSPLSMSNADEGASYQSRELALCGPNKLEAEDMDSNIWTTNLNSDEMTQAVILTALESRNYLLSPIEWKNESSFDRVLLTVSSRSYWTKAEMADERFNEEDDRYYVELDTGEQAIRWYREDAVTDPAYREDTVTDPAYRENLTIVYKYVDDILIDDEQVIRWYREDTVTDLAYREDTVTDLAYREDTVTDLAYLENIPIYTRIYDTPNGYEQTITNEEDDRYYVELDTGEQAIHWYREGTVTEQAIHWYREGTVTEQAIHWYREGTVTEQAYREDLTIVYILVDDILIDNEQAIGRDPENTPTGTNPTPKNTLLNPLSRGVSEPKIPLSRGVSEPKIPLSRGVSEPKIPLLRGD